jgi:hypothetical protein
LPPRKRRSYVLMQEVVTLEQATVALPLGAEGADTP